MALLALFGGVDFSRLFLALLLVAWRHHNASSVAGAGRTYEGSDRRFELKYLVTSKIFAAEHCFMELRPASKRRARRSCFTECPGMSALSA